MKIEKREDIRGAEILIDGTTSYVNTTYFENCRFIVEPKLPGGKLFMFHKDVFFRRCLWRLKNVLLDLEAYPDLANLIPKMAPEMLMNPDQLNPPPADHRR